MTNENIQGVLDQIRPALQADGGDVELVDVSADGVVKVKLTGACHGCAGHELTSRGVSVWRHVSNIDISSIWEISVNRFDQDWAV